MWAIGKMCVSGVLMVAALHSQPVQAGDFSAFSPNHPIKCLMRFLEEEPVRV